MSVIMAVFWLICGCPTYPVLMRLHATAGLLAAGLLAAGLLAVAGSVGAEAPDPFAPDMRDGRIILGSTPHRLLHFTFDDGPDHQTTPPLLEHLDRLGVKATFFVIGHRLRGRSRRHARQREILRDIARRGHTIGLHGLEHVAMTSLSDDELRSQIRTASRELRDVLGGRPWLFRPPYGRRSHRTDSLLAREGFSQVLWSLHATDIRSNTAEEVTEHFRENLDAQAQHPRGPGGVVLLHDTRQPTVDAFPGIVAEIERRNCALLDTQEELWDIVDDPRVFYTPRNGASSRRYAEPVVLPAAELRARQLRLRRAAQRRCGPAPLAQGAAITSGT